MRLPKVDFCGEGVWVILGEVEGVRTSGCVRKLRVVSVCVMVGEGVG